MTHRCTATTNDADPAVEGEYEREVEADIDPASGLCPTCLWTTEGASS